MAKKFLSELIDSCYREDIHAMVLRDRNHPSIISWSIGNEVIERKEIRVVHTAKFLKNAILECDATRPVTEALCAWDRDWEIYDPHFEVLDKAGNVCPEAAIPCNVTVTGDATLMSAASADLKDTEPYTSPRVTTWKGRAIIVVRSGNKVGMAKVSVKGGKLAGSTSV